MKLYNRIIIWMAKLDRTTFWAFVAWFIVALAFCLGLGAYLAIFIKEAL